MSTFPSLKTGAVVQSPTTRSMQFATSIIQFVDGSEQRFQLYPRQYRRWIISFDLLDEDELQNVRLFVEQTNGAAGRFSFTDPWDGTVYPTCSIEGEDATAYFSGPLQCGVKLIIRENRA